LASLFCYKYHKKAHFFSNFKVFSKKYPYFNKKMYIIKYADFIFNRSFCMKRIVCICFSLLLFAACSSNTVTPPACNPEEENCGGQQHPPECEGESCGEPGPQPPPPQSCLPSGDGLYVCGRQLMKNGNSIVLRGMSLYWYTGPWGGNNKLGNAYYTENTVQVLANNWGANLVRVAIGSLGTSYEDMNDALDISKKMMDWTKNHGIYVIIDNHSHIAHRPGPAASAKNFFRDISAYVKQKGYTHVIYEIYNEPVCDDNEPQRPNCNDVDKQTKWSQIKQYAQEVISVIRGNDPDGVIIVGTPNYSSYLTSGGLPPPAVPGPMDDPITGQKNIMYGFHFYAASHNSYKNRVRRAYCNDFPIFVSEWGTGAADGGGSVNTAESNSWMSIMEGAGLSWANWSLIQSSQSSGALSSSDVAGGTSTSGTLVKSYIKELNAGRSVSGVTPETITCN
jgi:endoglucanase